MSGKYGVRMTTYGYILPGAVRLANLARKTNISSQAKQRLKVVDWLRAHNGNISLTARHFGLNRETVRIWKNNFNRTGILGLNDKSKRPKHFRGIATSPVVVSEIVSIRDRFPAWSKYKIGVILKRRGIIVSPSTAPWAGC